MPREVCRFITLLPAAIGQEGGGEKQRAVMGRRTPKSARGRARMDR